MVIEADVLFFIVNSVFEYADYVERRSADKLSVDIAELDADAALEIAVSVLNRLRRVGVEVYVYRRIHTVKHTVLNVRLNVDCHTGKRAELTEVETENLIDKTDNVLAD